MRQVMITTSDNPYDPWDQWDEWYAFDTRHHYNTCGILARLAPDAPELSEFDERFLRECAMDQMIKFNFVGAFGEDLKYIKLEREREAVYA